MPRDQVRLLVARPDRIDHTRFAALPDILEPGDVLVVNTSATRPSALDGRLDGRPVTLHLSTPLDGGAWVVELRADGGRRPLLDATPGQRISLPGGARAILRHAAAAGPSGTRLWQADLLVPDRDPDRYLQRHARPISYDGGRFLLSDHQTVVATTPGSAEMASAGRPLSDRLITRLVARGVQVVPITLHAGVSSQVAGEPPQPEWRRVPRVTADAVNTARARGSRVVAVGTTSTRAIESAVADGTVRPADGMTDLVLSPDRPAQVIDGLVTGWHEADASHLWLLEAVAGAELVKQAYAEAVAGPYLWHEFGDSCLFLPGGPRSPWVD